jgi:hypothetical protein
MTIISAVRPFMGEAVPLKRCMRYGVLSEKVSSMSEGCFLGK